MRTEFCSGWWSWFVPWSFIFLFNSLFLVLLTPPPPLSFSYRMNCLHVWSNHFDRSLCCWDYTLIFVQLRTEIIHGSMECMNLSYTHTNYISTYVNIFFFQSSPKKTLSIAIRAFSLLPIQKLMKFETNAFLNWTKLTFYFFTFIFVSNTFSLFIIMVWKFFYFYYAHSIEQINSFLKWITTFFHFSILKFSDGKIWSMKDVKKNYFHGSNWCLRKCIHNWKYFYIIFWKYIEIA